MKKITHGFLVALLVLFGSEIIFAQETSVNLLLLRKLDKLPGVQVAKYEQSTADFFELHVLQPLDHSDPGKGSFTQRVFVSHRGMKQPVVLVTEGYSAAYADNPEYACELTRYLQANQVVVEHRFFEASVPDSMGWDYLTVANAAADHHRIVELLKTIYKRSEWINTGISKGGQTATYHRFFYPDDVDVTVGYVCPINLAREDPRIFSFLKTVGTEPCREKIYDFQKYLLENKKEFLPIFDYLTDKKGLTYSMGKEAAYELVICEYAFAFWQWGVGCDNIPGPQTQPKDAVSHLDQVAGFDFFAEESKSDMQPFFYQALTEIGMYSYDFSLFDGKITACRDSTFMFFMPENADTTYNFSTMHAVDQWIQKEAEQVIWLYGEYDPWSATAARAEGNPKVLKIVKPGGSHLTRIGNLPEAQQKLVFDTLDTWLKAPVYRPGKAN
ncbi:MAG: S28 family serine protease [Bacteroidales bacterium]|nr:aminopeptidase [Bacteroidales bacterium]MDD2321986.1 S28 family serine protease [Bacteroidales bacterium]MDD3010297.1 S28 family serine protease [Bacteroidales bacterium]MDD3960848.1 S28 family serine protease [Bacteroidales bacterium]MDY0284669.1 S28 family serine protease [Bacteroidales bacterium]